MFNLKEWAVGEYRQISRQRDAFPVVTVDGVDYQTYANIFGYTVTKVENGVEYKQSFSFGDVLEYLYFPKEGYCEHFVQIVKVLKEVNPQYFDKPPMFSLYNDGKFPTLSELYSNTSNKEFVDFRDDAFATSQRDFFIEYCGFVPYSEETGAILKEYLTGKSVIEVGCGKGLLSQYLHDHGVDITGVDLCDNFYSSSWFNSSTLPQWLIKGDFTDYPIEPFDVVISVWAPIGNALLKVLERMRPGQVLILEGEWEGCTANDDTFDYIGSNFTTDFDLGKRLNEHHYNFTRIRDKWTVHVKN